MRSISHGWKTNQSRWFPVHIQETVTITTVTGTCFTDVFHISDWTTIAKHIKHSQTETNKADRPAGLCRQVCEVKEWCESWNRFSPPGIKSEKRRERFNSSSFTAWPWLWLWNLCMFGKIKFNSIWVSNLFKLFYQNPDQRDTDRWIPVHPVMKSPSQHAYRKTDDVFEMYAKIKRAQFN